MRTPLGCLALACLALACLALWLIPLSTSARTIEAAWSLSYQTAELVTSVDSSGFYFEPVGDTIGGPTSGHLFPDIVLGQVGVGSTVFADASAGDDFARAVASLSDGQPGEVNFELPYRPPNPFHSYVGTYESQLFVNDPLGTGGVDLRGFQIDRIGFRLDSIAFDSPGSNGNGDGVWTDVTAAGTFLFEGESVPEVGAAALLGLVALGVGMRLTSALA